MTSVISNRSSDFNPSDRTSEVAAMAKSIIKHTRFKSSSSCAQTVFILVTRDKARAGLDQICLLDATSFRDLAEKAISTRTIEPPYSSNLPKKKFKVLLRLLHLLRERSKVTRCTLNWSYTLFAIIAADNFSKQSGTALRLSLAQPAVSARKSAHNSPLIFPISHIIFTVNVSD